MSEEPAATESVPPTPAAPWLRLPFCHQRNDSGDLYVPRPSPVSTALPLDDGNSKAGGSPTSEDAHDEGQHGGDQQEPIAMEGAPPTPAARGLQLPIFQDQRGDSSCDVPEGCPVASATPLSTAQCQETPSNEPPKKRPSLLSTEAPDDSESEIGDEECRCNKSPASEAIRHDQCQIRGMKALSKLEDAYADVRIDDGELLLFASESDFTGSPTSSQEGGCRDNRAEAACRTDDEDFAASCDEARGSLPESECLMVGCGECAPRDLLLPDMLPYFSVPDLLKWRVLSQRTRRPGALLKHVAEMGSMERPKSIIAFHQKQKVFANSPSIITFEEAFGDDAAQQKFYQCRKWCMALGRTRCTHFAENYVQSVVGNNLQSLLRHCLSADASAANDARKALGNYAAGGLPFLCSKLLQRPCLVWWKN